MLSAVFCGVLVAALAATAAAQSPNGPRYPRLANVYLHGGWSSDVVADLARWDLLVLNTTWPDSALERMRSYNPDIKMFMYVCHYCVQAPPPAPNVWETEMYQYALANDLWWYNSSGQPTTDWPGALWINITKAVPHGPQGFWADYLVNHVQALVFNKLNIDGIYYDNFWRWVSWEQNRVHADSDCNPTHQPEGCNGIEDSYADLDTLWHNALVDLAQKTRARFDVLNSMRRPDLPLAIIGGRPGDYYTWLNGGLYENFPQAGGNRDPGDLYRYNWSQEMFEWPEGYLVAPVRQSPFPAQLMNVNMWGTETEPTRYPDFERYKRFTLGSALLGDGYYSLDVFQHMNRWWEPEYDNGGRAKGYLGYPLGPYYKILEPTGTEMVVNPSFTLGVGIPWYWLAGGGLQGTFTADGVEHHSGPKSARIDVTVAPPNGYFKIWQTTAPMTNLGGYTLSFYAKATVPQVITMQLYSEQCPGSRCTRDRKFYVTTQWQRFDVPFVSAGASSAPAVNFNLNRVGTVWFDDVSLKEGDSSLYRRDFENGIALVNYTMQTQNVDLGGTFYHLDAHGWELYDGAAVTSEAILPSDGRILLRQSTETTDVQSAPGKTRLEANEPNPFNPTTKIRYALETTGPARLAVYDVAGRLVRVLLDASFTAGEHVATWDGRDDAGIEQPSGIYFYRLSTPEFTRARRMTLVR